MACLFPRLCRCFIVLIPVPLFKSSQVDYTEESSILELGKTTPVKALGKTWTISRLELRILRQWREWLVEQVGDPFADCERPWFDKLPDAEKLTRIKAAEKLAEQLKPHRFSITSDVSQVALQSMEGAAYFGKLMLAEHHPEIDDETAFQVWIAAGPELGKVLNRAQGKVPGGNGSAPVAAGEVQPVSLIGTGSISF